MSTADYFAPCRSTYWVNIFLRYPSMSSLCSAWQVIAVILACLLTYTFSFVSALFSLTFPLVALPRILAEGPKVFLVGGRVRVDHKTAIHDHPNSQTITQSAHIPLRWRRQDTVLLVFGFLSCVKYTRKPSNFRLVLSTLVMYCVSALFAHTVITNMTRKTGVRDWWGID
jgi:hypothetical protein